MRMYMRWPWLPVPGIDARTPIVSGWATVSHTLIVAQRLAEVTGLRRAPATAGSASARTALAATRRRTRGGTRGNLARPGAPIARSVMDWRVPAYQGGEC